MNLTARHLIGIHLGASATLVALTASWFLVGVQPLLSAKQRAATLGEEASAQRDAIRELVSKRDESGTRLASIEESLAQTTVRLKPASALNAQLAEITRLAEVEQIVVDRIEPSAMVETALATRVPVRFAGRGASPSAIRFLAALRKRFPDIAVEGFEMATQGNEAIAAVRFDCVWYADRTAERPASAAVQP